MKQMIYSNYRVVQVVENVMGQELLQFNSQKSRESHSGGVENHENEAYHNMMFHAMMLRKVLFERQNKNLYIIFLYVK